ncbi:hypothetical protein F5I97DRAFT_656762 [Phlebopus sp. FC_14]|nr:hypothetical protein F5I97DRAFT_656762 [Phlebopus sp. FC_14]
MSVGNVARLWRRNPATRWCIYLILLVNDKEPPDRPLRHWTYTFKHYGDFWSCTTVFGIIRLNIMSLTHGNAFENSAHDDFELWGSKRARTRECVRSADPKPKGRSIMAMLAHGTTVSGKFEALTGRTKITTGPGSQSTAPCTDSTVNEWSWPRGRSACFTLWIGMSWCVLVVAWAGWYVVALEIDR